MGDPPPGRGAEGRGAGDGYTTKAGRGPGAGRGTARGPRSRKPGTATGPRQGEPGSRPRLRAGRPRLRAAPRDQPALIGSLARHSPPLLRTAPTRGPRRDGGAAHPGTCSPSSLPPASCKRGGTTTPRGPSGRARPPGHPTPSPSFAKPPSLFFQPPPPHPPWSSILANSNVCTQHRIGPRGARAPPVPSCKLSTRRAPLSPHAGSPHPQCSPASPPPLLALLGAPKKPCTRGVGGGRPAHKPMHFAPNTPSLAAPPPRARDPGRLQPPGSCQPPPPLKLAERPWLPGSPLLARAKVGAETPALPHPAPHAGGRAVR